MNDFRADLHCHSTYSDGTCSPAEVLQIAVQKGLKGLSITDHDTAAGYPEAIRLGADVGITVIPGIEFSAVQDGVSVHILGYSFRSEDPTIHTFCAGHSKRRLERNEEILRKLAANKMPLDMNDLPGGIAKGSIGRPHIAAAMIRKGYVKSVNDAFKRYLREGALCYAPGPRYSVEETIAVIKAGGGLAVIAHPHLINNEKTVSQLLQMNFDGIEVFYANFPRDKCAKWLDVANQKGWLATGGSDFHGEPKPTISLGSSWAPQETFQALLSHYQSHTPL